MLDMAKRVPPKSESKQPPQRRTGESLSVWLPSDLFAELEAFVAASDPKTSKTAVVVTALRGYFRRHPKPPTDTD